MSGIAADNTTLRPIGGKEAQRAMANSEIDAVAYVGGPQNAAIHDALWNADLKLMSFERADAYVRRVPYITKLTLPEGAIDLGGNVPAHDVTLIGTTAMLVARAGFPTALNNLLMDTARDMHLAAGRTIPPYPYPDGTKGFDHDSGFGFVDADAAVGAVGH